MDKPTGLTPVRVRFRRQILWGGMVVEVGEVVTVDERTAEGWVADGTAADIAAERGRERAMLEMFEKRGD